jgi:hypothetical protein
MIGTNTLFDFQALTGTAGALAISPATAAGMLSKAREQQELVETIEELGRAANERTNRNLALALADHGRDLSVALNLIEAEFPSEATSTPGTLSPGCSSRADALTRRNSRQQRL